MYTSYIGNKFLKIYREKNNLPEVAIKRYEEGLKKRFNLNG